MAITFVRSEDLPKDAITRDFVGEKFGGVGACVLFVDAKPGEGPKLHRHPYVEILIVLEGTSTFDDGKSKREVHAGEMAVVDADQPHGFINTGTNTVRQIDIHLSPRFITEWLA
ncbi:MAG TPA: cupin domain-containing protein [Candidatus Dormibacteraeota bacterium]|nr:cupin domain-containing protein [Candidatus Dormibacteraeota bacterium]